MYVYVFLHECLCLYVKTNGCGYKYFFFFEIINTHLCHRHIKHFKYQNKHIHLRTPILRLILLLLYIFTSFEWVRALKYRCYELSWYCGKFSFPFSSSLFHRSFWIFQTTIGIYHLPPLHICYHCVHTYVCMCLRV